ncbi:monovalent cation:proton antiporter-2 (CPA2) family protein [Asticcacaulis sp. AND118]|uniref:monovalent cation:proton antiporter-2 (CPA2) family protein n=1 Tax=Asticcacaulis sp. AND118 TaxID=2840468 RepID=UPI001CFFC944|nr:monovalent cation:proton antiporter-2 (CPA2) family protein [Asticcacaulis sp. AND118]UDF05710.1 monovalent cation:proton antiporter-2 (CPA2) family protein [Asticcacaulis sp. AND118]
MSEASHGVDLLPVVALLGAGVVAVPLFRRLGLGSVLGYLAAGIAMGPFGLKIIAEPSTALHVAELGVVMFLFVIGLEMRPARLWAMRGQIFGLGAAQVGLCALLLTGVGIATGFPVAPSFVAGAGFVLTSTAIVMQILQERKRLSEPDGQKMVSILLFEDLAIVPLLILVTFLAPVAPGHAGGIDWVAVAVGLGCLAGLILAGRYLLNPMFALLANAQAREVMTAAALLVVLGAAWVMQLGGLSMAMGAFLAGVLLSESHFRHQLEADIEPFRGILLGLFFLAVGMSLDLGVVAANWRMIAFYVAAYMIVKAAAIYAVARVMKSDHAEALERAVFMAQGGEFAFVLYGAAAAAGIITGEQNAMLTAIVILSMVLTPLTIIGLKYIMPKKTQNMDGMDAPREDEGHVLIIGFGRIGQVASQLVMAAGHKVSTIDNDVEMIRTAGEYGFKVYYGDGGRLDILHAAGAHHARAVLVCVDKPDEALKIVELMKAEFPLIPVLTRAFDRYQALKLVEAGVDFQIRDTFESALVLGRKTLETLGEDEDTIAEMTDAVRERDETRFEIELTGGLEAGKRIFHGGADYLSRRRRAEQETGIVS